MMQNARLGGRFLCGNDPEIPDGSSRMATSQMLLRDKLARMYNGLSCLPRLAIRKGVVYMSIMVEILRDVVAGVILYCICKWLDSEE